MACAISFDLVPTIYAESGIKPPKGIEGKNLLPAMTGEPKEIRKDLLLIFRGIQCAVRTQDWKLIRYPQINKSQLFDLRNDPDEINDLAGKPENTERVNALMKQLQELQKEFGDTQPLSTDKPEPLLVEGIHYRDKKP